MSTKKLIITVCRGNIVRSPVAAAFIEKEIVNNSLTDQYEVISRGVQGTSVDPQPVKHPNITFYGDLYKDAQPTLQKYGIDMISHRSQSITSDKASEATIMFAMDQKTKDALLQLFPKIKPKLYLLSELINENRDIIDPETLQGADKQQKIIDDIYMIIHKGFPQLLKLLP